MPDVERLAFGTAAIGLPYGLPRNELPPTLMSESHAAALVRGALATGLQTFDTAPGYGLAEERLGRTLDGAGGVWTKLTGSESLLFQLERSLATLRRGSIDLMQWHNWTASAFEAPTIRSQWEQLRQDPRVRSLGASTYGVRDANDAVVSGFFDVVQIEWNVLNQSVIRSVGDEATRRGVKLAVRSVYLQGVLTDEGRSLPGGEALAHGVARARKLARDLAVSVEHLALRAALDQPHAKWVVVGFDQIPQIERAKRICDAPPLPCDVADLDLGGHPETDPRTWTR